MGSNGSLYNSGSLLVAQLIVKNVHLDTQRFHRALLAACFKVEVVQWLVTSAMLNG